MANGETTQFHGTCVAQDGCGLLLTGESGSGKSDLALRLIGRGWMLVADDRVDVRREGEELIAAPPDAIAGLLEIRGIGIIEQPCMSAAPLAAVIALTPPEIIERLPQNETMNVLGVRVPLFHLHAFETSACDKVAAVHGLVTGAINKHHD